MVHGEILRYGKILRHGKMLRHGEIRILSRGQEEGEDIPILLEVVVDRALREMDEEMDVVHGEASQVHEEADVVHREVNTVEMMGMIGESQDAAAKESSSMFRRNIYSTILSTVWAMI